ncbi:MAG: RNA pseudouridine synthase, partial [Desulfosalsimonadaceae bacterium]
YLSSYKTGRLKIHGHNDMIIEMDSIQIPVLAAGRGWLAVDKPAGMSVHNAPGEDLCSLVSQGIRQQAELLDQIGIRPPGAEGGADVNPVHRLDRETSGVILLSTDPACFRFFSQQFNDRLVRKTYVALVHGRLEAPEDAWGMWQWPLSKTAGGRTHPQGPSPRQPSRTKYRAMDHSAHYTLVEIELLTGRTHQIRRHAKLAGHPVVGDARYGSDRAIKFLKDHCGFDRLALHAQTLILQLPGEKEQTPVETQKIPDPMQLLFENDRSQ